MREGEKRLREAVAIRRELLGARQDDLLTLILGAETAAKDASDHHKLVAIVDVDYGLWRSRVLVDGAYRPDLERASSTRGEALGHAEGALVAAILEIVARSEKAVVVQLDPLQDVPSTLVLGKGFECEILFGKEPAKSSLVGWYEAGETVQLAAEQAKDFADALSRLVGKPFGWAVEMLKAGKRVTRPGWNGKGMWLGLASPNYGPQGMTLPFVYMRTADAHYVPWLASQTDILAEDWVECTP